MQRRQPGEYANLPRLPHPSSRGNAKHIFKLQYHRARHTLRIIYNSNGELGGVLGRLKANCNPHFKATLRLTLQDAAEYHYRKPNGRRVAKAVELALKGTGRAPAGLRELYIDLEQNPDKYID